MKGKKTTTTSKETATTTPNIPGYVQPAVTNYFDQLQRLNPMDNIASYQTPINAVQQAAANAAQNLGTNPGYAQSNTLAMNAANAPAPTVTAGMAPTAAQAASQGYSASLLDPASIAMAQAAQIGPAAQAALAQAEAARTGNAHTVNLGGYGAAQAGPVTFSDPVKQAEAQSLLTNFAAYMNPATQSLVDATMGAYDDQTGRSRAAMSAQAAKNGAFGGSRYGIAQSQFEADSDRNRALTDATLRNNAFGQAVGMSQYDATNRQNAGLFNAGALNERTNLGAQLTTQNNQFNTGQTNQAREFTANAKNTGLLANQQWLNDFLKTNAGFQQQANLFNAGEANTTNRFNAGETNQNARTQAGLDTNVNLANAGARNQGLFANQGAQNDAARFGAGAANTANLANQQANNTANNLAYSTNADMSRFNASQQQQQLQNQLAAAGLLGNNASAMSGDARANAGLQMDIGNSLYDAQRANNMLPLGVMDAYSGFLNPSLIAALSGQTLNSSGTGTTKESGGLLGQLLAAGAQVGSAALMSERRVKRDIELLGREDDGLGVYRYRYHWEEPGTVRHGVMVDEVETLRPWALGPVVDGVQTVDYSKLEEAR